MTTGIDNIFDLFVRDLKLELVPKWGEELRYKGGHSNLQLKTKGEIMQSLPFIAFIDGYEGNARKYQQRQGPKGISSPMTNGDGFSQENLRAVVEGAVEILEGLKVIGDIEAAEILPGGVYNKYYERGAAYYGRF